MLQLFVYQFITLNDSNDMTTTLDNSTKSNIKPDQSIFAKHDICKFYAPCLKDIRIDDEISFF